jgi:hypothetical protein
MGKRGDIRGDNFLDLAKIKLLTRWKNISRRQQVSERATYEIIIPNRNHVPEYLQTERLK